MGRFRFVAGFLAGAVLASGAAVVASIPDSASGEITACYSTRSGAIRLIDAQVGVVCRSGEVRVSWNEQGPPGPPGSSGGFELVGDDGTELGSVVNEVASECWIVWDGADFVSYDSTSGEPCFNVQAAQVYFSDSQCTGVGDIYVASDIIDTANAYSIVPTIEFTGLEGVEFVQGVTQGPEVVELAYQLTGSGMLQSCVAIEGNFFYKVIGAGVEIAAGPLTVQPAD